MEERQKRPSRISWYAIILALLFVGLCTSIIIKFVSQVRIANDELIAEHIVQLQDIFKKIHETCKITGFRHKKDYIDFLNVISFAGTVVGPMNLLKPENWQGPYVQESLTIDGQEYQIVATKAGFYIVPGDGVKLSNGKVIGKSLIITPNSNIELMIRDPQALLSNNKPLAARIETFQNPFEALTKTDFIDEEIETLH